MKHYKYIQLELPFTFSNDKKPSNMVPFPREKVLKKREEERLKAIEKGLEKSVKSLRWYK